MTKFWKTQSIGNDFVLVHDLPNADWPLVAQNVCDRRFGIGADGLLVVSPSLTLRMFNPDGTEDFCGNGSRCAAWHIFQQGWASRQFVLSHFGRDVPCSVRQDGLVESTLPPASFDPDLIPLAQSWPKKEYWEEEFLGYQASVLSTGSAHMVIFCEDLPNDETFFRVSPAIETDQLFPERVSIMWAKKEAETSFRLRIWERGVGETLGCGTGSSAVSVCAMRRLGHGGEYRILNPGGELIVRAESWLHPVTMISACTEPYHGLVDLVAASLPGNPVSAVG
ncbi:MAG: diaminopimelate epimerase [Fimbriimonadaceae bacterium]|jgi:diaminopimelate epimerase|nr:diaminopimelate epimerase [Fimbriimonadaceae bacterium]